MKEPHTAPVPASSAGHTQPEDRKKSTTSRIHHFTDTDTDTDLEGISRCGRVQDEPHHHRQVLQLHSSQSGHDGTTDLKHKML